MNLPETKDCFVIAPIGEAKTETRRKSDLLFTHVIKPVMDEFNYTVDRADKIGEPGIITSQVIQRIEKSPLVLADLTGPNANVFYELAIRHAIRKPLIQLITKGEPIPFDVAGLRTISYDLTDLDSVDETKKEIKKQVQAIESGTFKMDTPISTAVDLMKLRESGNPEQQSLAKVTDLLTVMKRQMNSMESEIIRLGRYAPSRRLVSGGSGGGLSMREAEIRRIVEIEKQRDELRRMREMSEARARHAQNDDELADDDNSSDPA